jgi:Putative prokaryotic signal transducing protein
MKKIFSSPDSADLELLRNMLENAGIVCEVRNGDVSRTFPAPPFYEELWVADEEQARASELVSSWQQPPAASGSSWTCPACGERIEAQFSSCWKCGGQRPQTAS